jgi:hypothetical protein
MKKFTTVPIYINREGEYFKEHTEWDPNDRVTEKEFFSENVDSYTYFSKNIQIIEKIYPNKNKIIIIMSQRPLPNFIKDELDKNFDKVLLIKDLDVESIKEVKEHVDGDVVVFFYSKGFDRIITIEELAESFNMEGKKLKIIADVKDFDYLKEFGGTKIPFVKETFTPSITNEKKYFIVDNDLVYSNLFSDIEKECIDDEEDRKLFRIIGRIFDRNEMF